MEGDTTMKNIRLMLVKILTYIQLIAFISIPVYIILALFLLRMISNFVLVTVAVAITAFFVFRYVKVRSYLK